MTDKLYNSLVCALTHNLEVCENCKKCGEGNCVEIRMNLIKELAKAENKKLPWTEEK